MNLKLINALLDLEKTKGLFSFEAETEVKTLQKSRITKAATPVELLGARKYVQTTVSLGNDYEQVVNNRLSSESKESTFEASETYCEPVSNSKILFAHKEKAQFYLRVYPDLCPTFKAVTVYITSDGKRWTSKDFYDKYSEYLPGKKESNKNQGLDQAIAVLNYKLENVKRLKRGDFEYAMA